MCQRHLHRLLGSTCWEAHKYVHNRNKWRRKVGNGKISIMWGYLQRGGRSKEGNEKYDMMRVVLLFRCWYQCKKGSRKRLWYCCTLLYCPVIPYRLALYEFDIVTALSLATGAQCHEGCEFLLWSRLVMCYCTSTVRVLSAVLLFQSDVNDDIKIFKI